MNITIDKQLKKLRKDKDITQEALANHLGITVQAVSKWERGEGFPDITLLPSIASFFNVSVDDILGVGEIEKQRIIDEYREKDTALFREGKSKERVALLREAIKEFPNDLRMVHDLTFALMSCNRDEYADEIIELGKRILDESTDNSLRSGAIQVLSFTYYYSKGDAETAKQYALLADNMWVSTQELLPRFLDGDEAVIYCQENLQELVEMIRRNSELIANKANYSPADRIKVNEFILNFFNLLYPNGDFGFYHCRMSDIFRNMAWQYKTLGDVDKMFESLEKAVEHTIKYDTRTDGMYTSFMVNKVKMLRDSAVKDYEENDSALLLNKLKSNYNEFETDERFTKLKNRLSEIAVYPNN